MVISSQTCIFDVSESGASSNHNICANLYPTVHCLLVFHLEISQNSNDLPLCYLLDPGGVGIME